MTKKKLLDVFVSVKDKLEKTRPLLSLVNLLNFFSFNLSTTLCPVRVHFMTSNSSWLKILNANIIHTHIQGGPKSGTPVLFLR